MMECEHKCHPGWTADEEWMKYGRRCSCSSSFCSMGPCGHRAPVGLGLRTRGNGVPVWLRDLPRCFFAAAMAIAGPKLLFSVTLISRHLLLLACLARNPHLHRQRRLSIPRVLMYLFCGSARCSRIASFPGFEGKLSSIVGTSRL